MSSRILLDSGPLGRLITPTGHNEIRHWLAAVRDAGYEVLIPEISDYEVRRSLLLEGLTPSLTLLDQLEQLMGYERLTTDAIRLAAQFWADVRKQGMPTADKHALDGDVILAAQAVKAQAIIATENVKHLVRIKDVDARHWKDIP